MKLKLKLPETFQVPLKNVKPAQFHKIVKIIKKDRFLRQKGYYNLSYKTLHQISKILIKSYDICNKSLIIFGNNWIIGDYGHTVILPNKFKCNSLKDKLK